MVHKTLNCRTKPLAVAIQHRLTLIRDGEEAREFLEQRGIR